MRKRSVVSMLWFALAMRYEPGNGVRRSAKRAKELLLLALDEGDNRATEFLKHSR